MTDKKPRARGTTAPQAPLALPPLPAAAWALLALVAAGVLVLITTFRLYDHDIWQHLRVGRTIWETGAVPDTQLWVWPTYGQPDVPPSWLFRALLWPFWDAGGVHGVFAWRDNETWRLRRYVIGDREHTWDGNRTTARPEKDDDKAKARDRRDDRGDRDRDSDRDRDRDAHDDERLGTLTTFVLVALVLVMVAGFVGHWMGSSRANDAVGRMQLELLKARAEGSQLAIASIDNDLTAILRDAVNDRAVQAPVAIAVDQLDQAIAALAGPPGAAPGTPADPAATIDRLRQVKARLMQVLTERQMAEALLAQITAYTQQNGDLRVDLARDVARQRAGIGTLYAELATQVGKADPARVKRLLDTAASLDPGNRGRYAKQLQELAPGARLADAPATVVPAVPSPADLVPPTPRPTPRDVVPPTPTPTPTPTPAPTVTPAAPLPSTPAAGPAGATVPGSRPDGGSR